MTVQDDERERELSALFGLEWDVAHQRHGVDAILRDIVVENKNYSFEVEVKSSTVFDIGTARDFGMHHIERWRKMMFVFGFYSKERRPELQFCLCLTPMDMEPWLAQKESQMLIDFKLASRVPQNLTLDDLFVVCGKQQTYSIEDARKLHKNQYTALEYQQAVDTVDQNGLPRISQKKMLEILKQRALYIAERGSTLNNPHISKTFLSTFLNTDREIRGRTNCALRLKSIAEKFIQDYPGHLAAIPYK